MKTKLSLLGMYSLIMFVLLSCQKDDSNLNSTHTNAKLKQVLLFSNIDSQDPISIVEEYEYDDNWKISKVSSPMYTNGTIVGTIKYDVYEYNESGQLIKIMNYNANIYSPTGFINLKNTTFTYSTEGTKIKETIEYPLGGITEYSDFEYQNGLLSKIEKYSGNKLESYTEFQYDKSDKLIKETLYTSDDQCISYTIHSYTGSLQTKSDLYTYPTNAHYRSINRTFDKNNNIITLESKELSLYSSMMSHVLRYKYYE
ncbi:MAG TPA: hypothetical protein VIK14_12120 [Ignavibacteria bacterium]